MSQTVKQNPYRAEAERFFDWFRLNLRALVEKLSAADKKEFERGIIPKKLLGTVRAAWSRELQEHLPGREFYAVVRSVLTNPRDYAMFMNCNVGKMQTLPKRIQAAVSKAGKSRAAEIHAAFFANDGEARLTNYLRVKQSQKMAMRKLINQATGMKVDDEGNFDPEQYFLEIVAAKGTALGVAGLRDFLGGIGHFRVEGEGGKTFNCLDYLPDTVWASEARLNSFLKRLGRALEPGRKSDAPLWEPDWPHGVDQALRYIVEGWCQCITVDGENWPPLCFLTNTALATFLTLCQPPRWLRSERTRLPRNPRSLEQEIRRLGLVNIRKGKIKLVEKKCGEFCFA